MSLLPSINQAAPGEDYYLNGGSVGLGGNLGATYPVTYYSNLNAIFISNALTTGNPSIKCDIALTNNDRGVYRFAASINVNVSTGTTPPDNSALIWVQQSNSPGVVASSVNTLIYPGTTFAPSPAYPYLQGIAGYFTISSSIPGEPSAIHLQFSLDTSGANTCRFPIQVSNVYIQQVA